MPAPRPQPKPAATVESGPATPAVPPPPPAHTIAPHELASALGLDRCVHYSGDMVAAG